MPATRRPELKVSSIANSSATRTGFWIGMFEPSSAILARLTRWATAAAMTIGLGVSDIGELELFERALHRSLRCLGRVIGAGRRPAAVGRARLVRDDREEGCLHLT